MLQSCVALKLVVANRLVQHHLYTTMRAEAAFVSSIEERLRQKRFKPLKLPKLELLGNSIVFSLFKVLFLVRASVC